MIGVRLWGGVGGLPSGMMGEIDSAISACFAIPANSLIRIGWHGMGVTILGGCCSSGMPLKGSGRMGEFVGTVGMGTSILCSGL